MKTWGRIPQNVKYIAIGLGGGLAISCFLFLVAWHSPYSLFPQSAVDVFYDPPGGCLVTDAPDQVQQFSYFDIPETAENVTIISDRPNTDICYVMVSFDLSREQAAAFFDKSGTQVISESFSDGGFWYGASVAGWPLIEGGIYMHGRSSRLRNEIKVVYERGTLYAVMILGN